MLILRDVLNYMNKKSKYKLIKNISNLDELKDIYRCIVFSVFNFD